MFSNRSSDTYLLGRFEKFYSDREAQMIKEEKKYCAKLLSLLWTTKFIMKTKTITIEKQKNKREKEMNK